MISARMQEAINAQINAEMWSAYLYLSMSLDAQSKGFAGVSHWFRKQYSEEMEHAFKFVSYLESQGARVNLLPIDAVPGEWSGVVEMFEKTLEHEKKVTSLIWSLCDLAADDKDYATTNFLQYYVSEQVEEEATAFEILEAAKMVEGDKAATYLLDQKLGAR